MHDEDHNRTLKYRIALCYIMTTSLRDNRACWWTICSDAWAPPLARTSYASGSRVAHERQPELFMYWSLANANCNLLPSKMTHFCCLPETLMYGTYSSIEGASSGHFTFGKFSWSFAHALYTANFWNALQWIASKRFWSMISPVLHCWAARTGAHWNRFLVWLLRQPHWGQQFVLGIKNFDSLTQQFNLRARGRAGEPNIKRAFRLQGTFRISH